MPWACGGGIEFVQPNYISYISIALQDLQIDYIYVVITMVYLVLYSFRNLFALPI